MGLAVVVDQEACIAFQGSALRGLLQCLPGSRQGDLAHLQHNDRAAANACSSPSCIRMHRLWQVREGLHPRRAAIKVFPIALAKGCWGKHYRLGWEQKARRARPWSPDTPHQYNLPGRALRARRAPVILGEAPCRRRCRSADGATAAAHCRVRRSRRPRRSPATRWTR